VEGGCSSSIQGVGKAIQFKGLADGGEGILDSAGFDLESSAEATLPCPFSKSLKDVNPFFWTKAVEVGIETGPNECAPMVPVTLALRVICFHNAIGDVPVCSAEKTFPMVAVLRWHMSQDAPCRRGKVELKCEKNSWSLGNVSNEHDAKSAMWLSAPDVESREQGGLPCQHMKGKHLE